MAADLIDFDADRLYWGIIFHLRQHRPSIWRTIDSITPDSVLHLWHRLRLERRKASVSRWQWKHWNDHERFLWLLEQTQTYLSAILATMNEDGVGTWELAKMTKQENRGNGITKETETKDQ